MPISKVKFTKAGNIIILILIFIIIITCYDCFYNINSLGININSSNLIEGFNPSDNFRATAETDIHAGTEKYIEDITKVATTSNNLTTNRTNLTDTLRDYNALPSQTWQGFDAIRKISTLNPMPVAFAVVNINITNRIYYADSDSNIRYFNVDSPTNPHPLTLTSTSISPSPINSLKFVKDDQYLVCIANEYAFRTYVDPYENLPITWWELPISNIKIKDIAIAGNWIYYIKSIDNKIYYHHFDWDPSKEDEVLDLNNFFQTIEIVVLESPTVTKKILYAMSTDQELFIITLTEGIDDLYTEAANPLFDIFEPINSNLLESMTLNLLETMALNITTTITNDPDNKIYFIDQTDDITKLCIAHSDTTLLQPTNPSQIPMPIDASFPLITNDSTYTLRINKMNNYLYLLNHGNFYTFPLNENVGSIGTTFVDYVDDMTDTIGNMNQELTSLTTYRTAANTLADQYITSAENNWNSDLSKQVKNLSDDIDKLHYIREIQKDITGNIGEQSVEYNRVYIKYLFWVLISIITIILLVINYITPDVITTELIIAYIAIIAFLIYVNRTYLSRYLTNNFNVEEYFSKNINPLVST